MIDAGNVFEALSEEQVEKFDVFARLLREENRRINLTSVDGVDQIRARHFCDSLAGVVVIEKLFETSAKISLVDIGSGAGFPGLALAIALGHLDVVSVEATGKKVAFQQRVIDEANIANAKAVQGRAEELAHDVQCREKFDVVTARAVAPLGILVELALGFVKCGGYFLAWKGAKGEKEIAEAKAAIETMGGEITEQVKYQVGAEESNLCIVCIKKIKPTPKEYPRKFGVIKKRTLGR
ncbi:MAG: 16S rRNA (guanine(527)-N(7))-methyltransferase RsmG [Planctomycetes bacterium]|nr:16S rRNA (guanine(527)-N(7))-methyltransferase RsmG [Planctomycetota bacterium]